jgi:hypothetical protein
MDNKFPFNKHKTKWLQKINYMSAYLLISETKQLVNWTADIDVPFPKAGGKQTSFHIKSAHASMPLNW